MPAIGTFSGHGLLQTTYTGSGTVAATLGGKEGATPLIISPPAPPTGALYVLPSTAITYAPGGPTVPLEAVAAYSDGELYNVTPYASWSSSNASYATVSSGGVVTPVGEGIMAATAYFDGAAASAEIEVLGIVYLSIAVTPNPVTLAESARQQFIATGTLTNGDTADITSVCSWSSSNGNILTMAPGGVGSAVLAGTCSVFATYLGITANAGAEVTAAAPLPTLNGAGGGGGGGSMGGSGKGSAGGEGGIGGGAGGILSPAGGSEVFMCCSNWPTLLSWDRVSSSASVITGSPANVKHIAWFGAYMYALTDTTLWFSDTSNPYSWPSDNNIPLSLSLGIPRYLKAMQDRLYIFCTNGVFYLMGDPEVTGSLYIGIFLEDVPVSKGNIAFDGGTCMFISYENIVSIAGNLDMLSPNMLGFSLSLPIQTWLSASPEYLFIRSFDLDGATLLYVFDRTRYRCWYRWRYEPGSALTNLYPKQLCVLAFQQAGQLGVLIPGEDGNLYFQGINTTAWNQMYPIGIPDMEDYPNTPIINRLGTRYTACIEDRLLGKQLRGFSIYGRGNITQIALNFIDDLSNLVNYTPPLATTTLPFEQPTVLMDLPVNTWQEAQMIVTGTQMSIRELAWSWRPLRYLTPRLGQ